MRDWRRRIRVTAVAVATVLTLSLAPALLSEQPAVSATTADASANAAIVHWPRRISSVGSSHQLIVVTSQSWRTSHGSLQAWQDKAGSWTRVLGPVPARLGWNGWAIGTRRRQNTGTTPAGVYGLSSAFGLLEPPGVRLPYHLVQRGNWWPYDPRDASTYNVMQWNRHPHATWRTTWAEHLITYRPEYRYAVVVDFNLPSGIHRVASGERVATQPANTRRGGGIFVHVNGSGATAGCVSVAAQQMRWLVRWLNPTATPLIAMGPRAWLLTQ